LNENNTLSPWYPILFLPQKNEEGKMIIRFHGLGRHKKYSTIAVHDRKVEEVHFQPRCVDLQAYLNNLDPGDAVIMEACTGACNGLI
jgi:hypothetical protein